MWYSGGVPGGKEIQVAGKKISRRSKKNKNKNQAPALINSFAGRTVLTVVMLVVLLAGAGYGIRYFFLRADFFDIKEIVVNKDRGYSFEEGERRLNKLYTNRNIFSIKLEQIRLLIRKDFPQLKKIEVRRGLPDRLEIDIVSREPFAVIDTGSGIVIDKEGVVLNIGSDGTVELPRIRGMSFFLNLPSRGEKVNNATLDKALVLIEGLRRTMGPWMKYVGYVDIGDRNNIVVDIKGVPVKMGMENFSGKIQELQLILNDPKMNLDDIKYIDLRFEGAVISPK